MSARDVADKRPATGDGAGRKSRCALSVTTLPRAAPDRGGAGLLHLHRGRVQLTPRLHEPSSPVLRTLVVRASPVSKNSRGVAVVSFSRWLYVSIRIGRSVSACLSQCGHLEVVANARGALGAR